MKITEILKNDHQAVMRLIEELEDADDQIETATGNQEIFDHLNKLIKTHTGIEEEIFYPAMKEFSESRDLVRVFHKEHKEIDQLLSSLSVLRPGSDPFQKALSLLLETIERHVDEEENELFPLAESLCGEGRLQELGRRVRDLKEGGRSQFAGRR
jgi:hemerythrin-like domain-containing protein